MDSDVQQSSCLERSLVCPSCGAGLTSSIRLGIEIDVCGDCRGVWLDRGELDKLLASEASQPRPSTPAQARGPAPNRVGRPPRRRSTWRELFD